MFKRIGNQVKSDEISRFSSQLYRYSYLALGKKLLSMDSTAVAGNLNANRGDTKWLT